MEEVLKEKQEQEQLKPSDMKIIYEIITVLANKKLSFKQCKKILNAVENELEDLIPWNQSSMNVKLHE
ncbi:hypothetical protein BVF91_09690 [Thermoanaerobacterium sp. PSU-2]|uniref:hypothetical protein n=1 Tax=Thermoanaerobacterium sp. PSU-2 TaxID=1930849 RepID=UPI000A16A7C3|nr:hypothetical protein [Thermoanaerobacterium sp. PSU-2]ORX22741.1 hypothetical protein BVF91_09690 [Thermoanaerobacterium sp. PSU-2]